MADIACSLLMGPTACTDRGVISFPFKMWIAPWSSKCIQEREIDTVAVSHYTRQISFAEYRWIPLDARDSGRILTSLEKRSEYVQWNNDSREEHFALYAEHIEGKEGVREKG